VHVGGFDGRGEPLIPIVLDTLHRDRFVPVAKFVIRDTSIASFVLAGVQGATVAARKTGTTWIVATRDTLGDTLRDSLQLVIR
jgi:hypothetical protein